MSPCGTVPALAPPGRVSISQGRPELSVSSTPSSSSWAFHCGRQASMVYVMYVVCHTMQQYCECCSSHAHQVVTWWRPNRPHHAIGQCAVQANRPQRLATFVVRSQRVAIMSWQPRAVVPKSCHDVVCCRMRLCGTIMAVADCRSSQPRGYCSRCEAARPALCQGYCAPQG